MVEAGSSTDADQCSASENQNSEISAQNNHESTHEMFQLLAKQIDDLKSEINLYSTRLSQNQEKLEQMQSEIKQDKLKEVELKKKLGKLTKAQSLLIETCKDNTTQESVIQTDQQDRVNDEINLASTSRSCNDHRNSVQVAQSSSQPELIEGTGRKSVNRDNIDDEVSSQNISDDASVSSYRPSEQTQSTETQSIQEVNVTASNLPWEIACQKLLHTLWENKDSYHFREPVDEKIYKDYRKYVITPLCLRDIEESFKSGVYKSPLDFSKDLKIIFDNSRKYNEDKTELIYKQTTRLKKLYDDQIKEIISNWRASKKSRGSSGSKRKVSDPDNGSDEDDDSQRQLKCRPKKRRHFLSDDESSLKSPSVINENSDVDDDVSDYDDDDSEDNGPISTRLRDAKRKARRMQDNNTESSESDTEDDDSFMESSDEDQSNAYDSASMDEEMENENLESLTSENIIKNFGCENFVTITGKVCKVFKTVKQPSVLKGKDFKLFKFLLKTKEGLRNVECVAWEDVAINCQSKVRRNQVITLEKVKVKSAEGKCYNQGNFDFQLILYNTSKITVH